MTKLNKNDTRKERYQIINRFNNPIENKPFLELFQRTMIERLLLNKDRKYHPENVKRIIRNARKYGFRINDRKLNLEISGGLLLSTTVEAELYIHLQETIKDLTGSYMPMDEFLTLMISWFVQYYNRKDNEKINLPFIRIKNNRKKQLRMQFHKTFSPYYKNISLT